LAALVTSKDACKILALIVIAKNLKDIQEHKKWKDRKMAELGEHDKIISLEPRLWRQIKIDIYFSILGLTCLLILSLEANRLGERMRTSRGITKFL
jgi:hypothetical protein